MSDTAEIEQVWRETVDALVQSGHVAGQGYGFVALVQPLGFVGDTVLLAVPNDYSKDFLESQLRETLTDSLSLAAGRAVTFAITVNPSLSNVPEPPPPTPEPQPALTPRSTQPVNHSNIQPRYTFESFVVGHSNRFAFTAARTVAEQPAKGYNPLFIYGDSGLGKTHLIHAIGNEALKMYPSLRILYVTSEDFTNDFINSMPTGSMEEFKRRYRQNDILLIDDIQFLADKGRTMEEFFHTFNSLYNSGSHVIITSDMPPKQLSGFEDRLRSRFEWGLVVDVLPPDLETRIAILRKKSAVDGIQLPYDVQEYIASRISSNVRELEGALVRVTAFASLNRQPVDLALTEVVLRDLVTDHDGEVTPSLIIGQTAAYFGFTIEEICGPSRNHALVQARHIAMYLCRELTDLSLPNIGREFGGRDHTTVLAAYNKIKATMSEKRLYTKISELTLRIRHHQAP